MRTQLLTALGALGVAAVIGLTVITASSSGGTAVATEPTGTAPAGTSTAGVTGTVAVTRTVVITQTPPITATPPRFEGCTPGYWKVRVHHDSWVAAGYATNQTLESVFDVPNEYGVDNETLLAAMRFSGGPTATDAAKLLLHHAVAALLNSAHPSVDYPLTSAQVIAQVNAALATGDRDTMLALKSTLDGYNNAGCPLN